MRLDQYLVENGYFESRAKAQREVKNGAISVNQKIITKVAFDITISDHVEIVKETLKYVSQGGLKLEGAIKTFKLDFQDKVVLDIGASTGGFTDCALMHGAKLVYAVDVGTLQLAEKLRIDKRVISFENTNILEIPEFDNPIDIIVMDVSFVSVVNLIPAIKHYLNNSNYLVLLIKPQFEVGHFKMKNGVLKDKKKHLEVLLNVNKRFLENGLYINKVIVSPIKGGSGNIEFLAQVSKNTGAPCDFKRVVEGY